MAKPKIVVTRRWPAAVEAVLAERYDATFNVADVPMDRAAMRQALVEADAVLPTVVDKLDHAVFEGLTPRARILANYGVGFSHIDIDAAKAHGIVVTNTPDVLSECTADIALTLILMVARRAGEGERELRAGQWTGWRPTHLVGTKVSGKTLGIIGFGRIAQAVARRAHFGFGMRVIACNRSPIPPDVLRTTGASVRQTIDEIMTEADFVSLHIPGGARNRHLIGAEHIHRMKRDAFLINTARGEVVDEEALLSALNEKKISGAGLDVFDGEPAVNPRFLSLDNVVLLPHVGSATLETREAMGFRALENLDAFFGGQAIPDRVA